MFYEKAVLEIIAKSTRKKLSQSVFFNKVADRNPSGNRNSFSGEFCVIFQNSFLREHFRASASVQLKYRVTTINLRLVPEAKLNFGLFGQSKSRIFIFIGPFLHRRAKSDKLKYLLRLFTSIIQKRKTSQQPSQMNLAHPNLGRQ